MTRPDFNSSQFNHYVAKKASNIDGGLDELSVIPSSLRIDDFQTNYARGGNGFKTWSDFRKLFDAHRRQFKRWLRANFSYTIIDCPPSLATQVRLLLGVSDTYIVPSQPNRLSLRGAVWLRERIQNAGYKRDCLGTLWSMCRGNDRMHAQMIQSDGNGAVTKPFETTIPLAANIAHAVESNDDQPLSFRGKYGTRFGRIYEALSEEIIERVKDAGYNRTAVTERRKITS